MAHQMQSRRCIVYCDLHTDTLWKRNADTRLEQCLDFAEYTMHSSRVAVSGSHIIDWAVSCVIKDKAKQSHALQPHGDRYPSIHWWLSVVWVGFANRATNGVGPVSSRPIGGPICCLVAHRASEKMHACGPTGPAAENRRRASGPVANVMPWIYSGLHFVPSVLIVLSTKTCADYFFEIQRLA